MKISLKLRAQGQTNQAELARREARYHQAKQKLVERAAERQAAEHAEYEGSKLASPEEEFRSEVSGSCRSRAGDLSNVQRSGPGG